MEIDVGRVIRSSTTRFVVGCRVLRPQVPVFVALVKVRSVADVIIFGLIQDVSMEDDPYVRQISVLDGAGEETIVARVGEGIVSTIGSAEDHKAVLENPDAISKNVLAKGLDAGTAYEILSIDIADVDVGANIGAKLNTERAEADKKVAQAAAEGRRAMALANEQEMQARVVEMQASLVEAESKVPVAMADALGSGILTVVKK